jgi:hypothetical protein
MFIDKNINYVILNIFIIYISGYSNNVHYVRMLYYIYNFLKRKISKHIANKLYRFVLNNHKHLILSTVVRLQSVVVVFR